MIDDIAVRDALEAVLGENYGGMPVSRVGEKHHGHDPHIRTYLVREPRTELYRGIRRAKGMFGILVHVPINDGIDKAEEIAAPIPALYLPNQTENSLLPGTSITIREASVMSPYRGSDEQEGEARWLIVPVQIDWRVDITA